MGRYLITLGDFLKNAGIAGMAYLLEKNGARKGIEYGVTEDGQALWLDAEFADQADWTDLYFKAFTAYFGPSTVYQGVTDRIKECLKKIEAGKWEAEKWEKDSLKFISEKLLSNSYQAGYENIKGKIEHPEVYEKLKLSKLNDRMDVEELQERLKELQSFIAQPICQETFMMKSIVYTYINRFWDGKCFLLRANAKKDMRELFEKEFSEPLRNYWKRDKKKDKDLCIDCAMPAGSKEKVSIAFAKDRSDDLSRKKSAFWNCKVDAFLCPSCAFVYALAPLGFRLFANKFLFINIGHDVENLLAANEKARKSSVDAQREEDEKYSAWFAKVMNVVLKEKTKSLENIHVILRGVQADDHYLLRIIPEKTVKVLENERAYDALQKLGKHPYTKVGNEIQNIHEMAIMNLLFDRSQYSLLQKLLRPALENEGGFGASLIYEIQLQSELVYKEKKERSQIMMSCTVMKMCGADLRRAVLKAKKTDSSECLRGTIYQLLNALSVRNRNKYMDIVLRLYSSYSAGNGKDGKDLLMPTGFVAMLEDDEKFSQYGYAFLLGLQGMYEGKKEDEAV